MQTSIKSDMEKNRNPRL